MRTAVALKISLAVIFFGCFIAHSWDMAVKFFSEKTLTIEVKELQQSMRMPDMTVCAATPYKTPGFHFNHTSFEENAYTFDQIFHHSARDHLAEKDFRVKEVMSQGLGRCFTLFTDIPFRSSRDELVLALREDGPGAVIFFHEREAEFFMATGNWMPGAAAEAFVVEDSENEDLLCLIQLELYETMEERLGKSLCHEYGEFNKGFYSCAEAATRKAIQNDGFRCSTVWWERFFPMDAEECALPKDLDEVVRMGKWATEDGFPVQFSTSSGDFGCPKPCRYYRYRPKCETYQDNQYTYLELVKGETEHTHDDGTSGQGHDTHMIRITFTLDLILETETMHLLYDFSGIVAGIGGSLGLFLGISCLGVGNHFVDLGDGKITARTRVKEADGAASPPPPEDAIVVKAANGITLQERPNT